MPPEAVMEYLNISRKARQSTRNGYILIVEDDMDIADLILKICSGHNIDAKVVFTVDEAICTIINDFSHIVMVSIDYIIDDKTADGIIEVCDSLNVPYIISTANSRIVKEKYPYATILAKPWHIETFLETLGVGHECTKTS